MRPDFAVEALTTRTARALSFGVAALVAVSLFALMLTAKPAHAKTFTVNSTSDSDDGECDPFGLFTDCTLREAMNVARLNGNAPTVDTINFNIPGSGVKTISPASALPDLIEPVTIDGYTQPGASVNTATTYTNAVLKIVLDGSNAGSVNGLALKDPHSTVRGLVINDFEKAGILCGTFTTGSRVRGNFIGTDATGTAGEGNGYGVWIEGNNNVIGGEVPAARNLISKNDNHGVVLGIFGPSSGNKVQSNLIGINKGGGALGNGGHGVAILSGSNNLIGGAGSAANTITFSTFDGVNVNSGTANRILFNRIHSNGQLGIDLAGGTEDPPPTVGITLNDFKDPDTGPNGLQNYPWLNEAKANPNGTTTITGTLNSRPERTYTIQFFAGGIGDPDGFGEGQTFVGQKKVETNKKGNAFFTFTTTLPDPGDPISATATGGGGTSEFAPWID